MTKRPLPSVFTSGILNRRPRCLRRLVGAECLETRDLLTGDVLSIWQNPVDRLDVNNDGLVTSRDALNLIRDLRRNGSYELTQVAEGEPGGSRTSLYYPDVNGDQHVNPMDVISVVRRLNAEGENGALMQFRLEVVDDSGNPISTAEVGQQIQLRGFIQDLRDGGTGLFAAYVDVEYDESLAMVPSGSAIEFTSEFPNSPSGDTSVAGLIDEVGAFIDGTSGAGNQEQLLFTVRLDLTSAGNLTFTTNAADILPAHETLFFDPDTAVDPGDVMFGSAELTIVAPNGRPDLVAFAQALDAAGVELWSTTQFCRDCADQRRALDDGADFLPRMEALQADGTFADAASAAGVTTLNTWIFPDGSRSEGTVLTPQQVSELSGVPIPLGEIPTLKPLDDVVVLTDSPLHIALDGYDPDGGPLTYTVTSSLPRFVEPVVLTGNRSWRLAVAGYDDMVFQLFEQRVPRATERIIDLTSDGFYDGLTFQRVINDVLIQGGDPLGDPTGSDLPDFDDQFHVELQHSRAGILSTVKFGDDTNNSQFLITDGVTRQFDFENTVFGVLVEGDAAREAIGNVPTINDDRPLQDIVNNQATVFTDNENAVLMIRTPENRFGEDATITVTATDIDGNRASQTFTVTVEEDMNNNQPFLRDLPDFTTNPGSTVEFQLEAIDLEANQIFYFAETSPASGASISVDAAGLVTMAIPEDVVIPTDGMLIANVSVASTANSSMSPFDSQAVRIFVGSDPTGATDDGFSAQEDSSNVALDVLANDALASDVDAVITALGTVELLGSAAISTDGRSVIYTPAPDFFGADSFTYFVTSAQGTATATVTVNVENVDDPPTANDDVYPDDWELDDTQRALLQEDATQQLTLPVLLNDTNLPDDVEQELFIVTSVSGAVGSATANSLNILYTAAPDFFGEDTFTYTITGSSTGLSATGTVTVVVPEENDRPIANGESFTVVSGQSRVFTAAELLANDTPGPDNESDQTLSVSAFQYDGQGMVDLDEAGNISYRPADGFVGQEAIRYTVRDNGTTRGFSAPRSSMATLTVNVTQGAVAVDDRFNVAFESVSNDLDVLANDSSPQTPLTIVDVADPPNGTVQIVDDTRLFYTPNGGFTGTDTFTYTIQDDGGGTATATVIVDVGSAPPTAVDDMFTVDGTATTLDVLDNDMLGVGATSLAVQSITQPSRGTVSIGDGGANVRYQGSVGFTGTDSFTYTVVNDGGQTSTATVSITVLADVVNSDPFAFNDRLEVVVDGGAQALDVLLNDTALPDEGEVLSIDTITMDPQNGTATVNATGDMILYTPDRGFLGEDVLVYQISDGNGGTDTATVRIMVVEENVPPMAQDDTHQVVAAGTQTIEVLANDSGEAGETLTILSVQADSAAGLVQISGDGSAILYTPPFGFEGTDRFAYTIDDGTGQTASALVTVTVPNLASNSFFSGAVFVDRDNNGRRNGGEPGIAGVTVVLEGTDVNGLNVRQETTTTVDGAYRFDGLGPGSYTITEQQPILMADGQELLAGEIVDGDQFSITVTDQLITSNGNLFGERGLMPELSALNTLASLRQPGLFVVLENNQTAWLEHRGGWDGFETIDVILNDDATVSIQARDADGDQSIVTVPTSDTSRIQMLGTAGDLTILRITGNSQDVLDPAGSPSAVDAVFAA